MHRFPDGAHVRLRTRIEGAYVYANEDGYGVSMSPHGASLNAVWAVHRLVRRGTSYVLLHGAAYGRYLSVTRDDAPRGHGRVVQRLYDDPRRRDVLWVAVEDGDMTGDVVMRNRRYGPWRRYEHPDETISWMVEAIPPRQDPPELPPVVPRHVLPQPVSRRSIQYGRATDQEGFNPLVWSTLWFDGQFVSNLRRDIANALGEHDELNVTLCVRGGSQGRLTPLVTDLPGDEQAMEIVVFTTGSQAAAELVYPDVDAQQQQDLDF
ncbi:hypothetical protein GQ55_4G329200 [Panicum hallii var. hallii]|uniref:Uncharacterized protein n=1 Tax=Panicum hallii var. hallii TaxID=1504633 RepID=A0A2T7E2L5_9POAL|nr:hypothetical protein GQ55_4G329200 [Panicum hallii var. hallii]